MEAGRSCLRDSQRSVPRLRGSEQEPLRVLRERATPPVRGRGLRATGRTFKPPCPIATPDGRAPRGTAPGLRDEVPQRRQGAGEADRNPLSVLRGEGHLHADGRPSGEEELSPLRDGGRAQVGLRVVTGGPTKRSAWSPGLRPLRSLIP